MGTKKKEYDLICSLGGNCSAAHNLRYRNMRHFSLPFDWCFIVNENPIKKLTECFQNDTLFMIAQKENLIPLTEEEEKQVASHSDTYHYKDSFSEYYFVNHFKKPLSNGGYEKFRKDFDKRLTRLKNYIEQSNNILFILTSKTNIEDRVILNLKNTLCNLYPKKNIDFRIMFFDAESDDELILDSNIHINKYTRSQNLYDFTKTNYEWAFLDDIKVSNLFKTKKLPILKKLFIILCPIKDFRRELRKKFIGKAF